MSMKYNTGKNMCDDPSDESTSGTHSQLPTLQDTPPQLIKCCTNMTTVLSTLQEISTTSPFTWNYIETNTSHPTQTKTYHTSQKLHRDYHSTTNITTKKTRTLQLTRSYTKMTSPLPKQPNTYHPPHTSSLTRSYRETTSP